MGIVYLKYHERFPLLGLLYESCVEFCQRRALSSNSDERSTPQLRFGNQETSSRKQYTIPFQVISDWHSIQVPF